MSRVNCVRSCGRAGCVAISNCAFWGAIAVALSPSSASFAAPVLDRSTGIDAGSSSAKATHQLLPPLQDINRSVLSIGSDVFTSFDANLLLRFWNLLAPTPVALTTSWNSTTGFVFKRELDLLTNINSWPPDASRLLFLGLVWAEAKRLNLFVPVEKEMEVALARVKKEGLGPANEDLQAYFKGLPETRLRGYLEIVLRARTFERVRGGFDKNSGLLNTAWFWHVQPLASVKKALQ